MAKDEFDPSSFDFSFPLWICRDRNIHFVVLGGTFVGLKTYVAVFTSKELAERYLAGRRKTDVMKLLPISSLDELLDFYRAQKELGNSYVSFDEQANARVANSAFKIDELIEQTERKTKEITP